MVSSLIALKIKWYGHAYIKKLYEYSIVVFLFCSIFVFGILNPLLISKPIATLLGNELTLSSMMFYLFTLNLIFIILFLCQRKTIFSHEFESYTKSLPISKNAHRISSLFVLFLSNNFLWVFLLMGAYLAWPQQPKSIVFSETAYLIASLLMVQLFLYEKNSNKLVSLILLNIMFVLTKFYLPLNITKPIIILFLSISIVGLAFAEIKNNSFKTNRYQFNKLKPLLGSVLPIQLAMLQPNSGFLFIKVTISLTLEAVAALFIAHIENTGLIYFIILFNYIAICIMASFSRVFALETKKMASYFKSLPMPVSYWFIKNQLVNLLLTLLILFPCSCFAIAQSAFGIWTFVYLFFVTIVINSVVYWSNSKHMRNTTLLMFLVALILYVIQFLTR